ncbi:odorant receptor 33c-like [Phlebotomus argentipes]|uniref:odorant receptor 33c-like n=1 Tax=Phlebotomus argentipes TaxID=94469 RepID=UPI002892E86D|nr:odorant receptor 33c-like [Phlebotomus argentipes]
MATIDLSVLFIGLQVMAALNVLNDYMELIDKKTKDKDEEKAEDRRDFLKVIILRHNEMIRNVCLFNEAIEKVSFVEFSTGILLLIFGFAFTRQKNDNIPAYILCFTVLMKIFMLCFFSEIIKTKIERLSETLYQTYWYELSLKDQKTFLLILAMSQREHNLRAAGMYDVNLNAFVQIVKLACSYCAILYIFLNE